MKEELYIVKSYDRMSWIVESDHNRHANIVDMEAKTCTCEDWEYRSSSYPKGEYQCKHIRMVYCAKMPKNPAIIRRVYCPKTKRESLESV